MANDPQMPPLPKGMVWRVQRRNKLIDGIFYFKLLILKKYGIFTLSQAETLWLPLPSDTSKREDYVMMQAEILVLTLPIPLALNITDE